MRKLILAVFVAACVNEPDGPTRQAPTCQNAVAHYYSVGCSTKDENGQPYPQDQVRADCLEILSVVPDRCMGEFDALRFCFADATAGNCDCSAEQEALLTCD